MSPIAWSKVSKFLAPMRRRWAKSFEKAISMGLRSGAVSRQEQEPAAALLQGLCRALTFVGGQVVENDNSPLIKCRDQLRLDIGIESRAVHCAVDHPWRDQGVLR